MNAQTDAALLEDDQASAETVEEQDGPPSEDATSEKNANPPTLDINFLALDGSPIAKMGVAIRWEGGELLARTDADGAIPPIEAPPGDTLSIAVQRFDGSYKKIGECCMPSSDGVLTAVSPNIVVETTTEKHEGKAGNAEERIPKPEQGDLGDLSAASKESEPNETAQPAGEAETKRAETAKPAPADNDKHAQPPKPAPKPKAQPKAPEIKAKQQADKPPQHISGKEEVKPKLEKGRDENGNPLAVITQKAIDWWNSWRMPTFNLWGTPASSAKGGTVPATPVKVDAEMVKKVEALLAFAREQTEYLYTEGTAGVLASMGKGSFKHAKKEKESETPKGLCYTYVKVALSRCKIVSGILADNKTSTAQSEADHYSMQDSASKAGPALIAKGFWEVTKEVPDLRWAAAGDIIVYTWSEATWNKEKKRKNNNYPNHGHIDIRSYTNYISDHIPKSGHPNWTRYNVIGIYRKIYDVEPVWRIKAFLRCLRERECTEEADDAKRYFLLNTAVPGTSGRRFSDDKKHPWAAIYESSAFDNDKSSAGAYQFKHDTWKDLLEKNIVCIPEGGKKFDKMAQDRLAVALMGENPWKGNNGENSALSDIRRGDIDSAINKLKNTWSCLPGAGEDRGLSKNKFMEIYNKYYEQAKRGLI
ncbi:hypothetical protein AT959_05585 [Dechloromonas denitrificans]|uniref:Uncharacterized protein n=1 Tax=Dechloromonas denitrificans TaxID=281362 RepID=A0A133XLM4_9RHOO|nr:hypothetical protein [Dechloromonas denitrificans]KXB31816.1 hypothetical protein AT959_05585 [Dechloromonas denitrificans]